MPNGGSDCCGTCWFNARNKGEAGYEHARDPEPNNCLIRGLEIQNHFWTYCGNHPHRRPEPDRIPIGPVFVVDDGDGGSYPRRVWQPSPDTEEIRVHLLELAAAIKEQPADEYPGGIPTDEMVVWQLGEFREVRAIADLERIAAFAPDVQRPGPLVRTRASLVRPRKRWRTFARVVGSATVQPTAVTCNEFVQGW